jgi:Tol biopolymer transport system component
VRHRCVRVGRLWGAVGLTLLAVTCLSFPAPAQATYHGRNGRIAGVGSANGYTYLEGEYPDGLLVPFHRLADSWLRYPVFSPLGTRLAYLDVPAGGTPSVRVIGWKGTNDHVIRVGDFQTLSWSSDGRQIFGAFGCIDCAPVIYAFNSDGTGGVRVLAPFPAGTIADSGAGEPEESPNGKLIVFLTDVGSREPEIWSMHPDASHLARLTYTPNKTDVELYKSQLDWAPDSSMLTFGEELQNSAGAIIYRVVVMDADGSHQRQIAAGFNPVFEPNGRFIVYQANDGSMRQIHPDGTGDGPYPYPITSTYQNLFQGPPVTWQALPGTTTPKIPVSIVFTRRPAEINVQATLGVARSHEEVSADLYHLVGSRWVLVGADRRLTPSTGTYFQGLNQQLSGTCLLRFHYFGDPRYLPLTVTKTFTCHS